MHPHSVLNKANEQSKCTDVYFLCERQMLTYFLSSVYNKVHLRFEILNSILTMTLYKYILESYNIIVDICLSCYPTYEL